MKYARNCVRSLTRSPLLMMLVAAVALVAAPAIASATPMVYTINQPNSALSGFTGPYGTVTVNLTDSTHATVTVATNTSGASGFKYLFGDGATIALNTNGAVSVVGGIPGGITATSPVGTPGPFSNGGAGNVSTFGNFNFSINNFDGAGKAIDTMSFTLQKSSGSWLSSADVLTPNADGFSVADHVFVYNNTFTGGAIVTGFAGNGPTTTAVPEPSTIALGLVSLACMGMYRRFRGRPVVSEA